MHVRPCLLHVFADKNGLQLVETSALDATNVEKAFVGILTGFFPVLFEPIASSATDILNTVERPEQPEFVLPPKDVNRVTLQKTDNGKPAPKASCC